MEIREKKLQEYLKDESILEFESNEAALNYFNTYDYQSFKDVKEMMEYQGRYGFNIGKKRYHINRDEALDVYKYNHGRRENFTKEELYLLSEAVLLLIANNNKARELISTLDEESQKALELASKRYQRLNKKICRMTDYAQEINNKTIKINCGSGYEIIGTDAPIEVLDDLTKKKRGCTEHLYEKLREEGYYVTIIASSDELTEEELEEATITETYDI